MRYFTAVPAADTLRIYASNGAAGVEQATVLCTVGSWRGLLKGKLGFFESCLLFS
jgi:hypothetical protein